MSKKVIIASDSTTDLGTELAEKNSVVVLPLGITLGDKTYQDGVDITPDDIYAHYEKTGQLPKTSAANIADFTDFFEKLTADGSSVVMFTISSEMSSTFSNARLAAEDFDDVYVVDTKNLSTGGGLLVLSACDMRDDGKSAKEIADECEAIAQKIDASFVIDNLEFLHKGGRCSALTALGANLLQIKPCISVRNGKMGIERKYRGKFPVVLEKYIADQIGDASDIELDLIFVTHAGCDEELCNQCVEQVKAIAPFKEVLLTRAGCSVSSHCGRNTLGVLFIRKSPLN